MNSSFTSPKLRKKLPKKQKEGHLILPSDGVKSSSEDRCSYVTPWGRHAGYSGPVVCPDVVNLHRVEVRNSIKPSHNINVVVEQRHAGP